MDRTREFILQAMYTTILSPTTKGLTIVVEQHAEKTPQQYQARVRHYWRNKAAKFISNSSSHALPLLETYPALRLQGVINLLNPYPHTFLFTVMLTNRLPAMGL